MYEYEAVVRAIMEDRIREANHQRLTRGVRRHEGPSPSRPATQEPQRHSRLWTLAHFHRAYN